MCARCPKGFACNFTLGVKAFVQNHPVDLSMEPVSPDQTVDSMVKSRKCLFNSWRDNWEFRFVNLSYVSNTSMAAGTEPSQPELIKYELSPKDTPDEDSVDEEFLFMNLRPLLGGPIEPAQSFMNLRPPVGGSLLHWRNHYHCSSTTIWTTPP
jgi:hypothetical protein